MLLDLASQIYEIAGRIHQYFVESSLWFSQDEVSKNGLSRARYIHELKKKSQGSSNCSCAISFSPPVTVCSTIQAQSFFKGPP